MPKIFELVTAKIRLDRSEEFHHLHKERLMPILERYGVKPVFLSLVYAGDELGTFFDVYEYPNLSEYERITSLVEGDPELADYYKHIQPCIYGSIKITLLRAMDYSPIQ